MIDMNEFHKKYCLLCGSQRCEQEGIWLEGCLHYKNELKKEEANKNDLRRTETGTCQID